MRVWLLALVFAACACDGGSRVPQHVLHAADGGVWPGQDDDHDGLCNATETRFGTDPESADTDGDGVPDLIELGNGFDAVDPSDPAPDHLAYLDDRTGATLDFSLRFTVNGDGQGMSGYFDSIPSIYADGSSADD